MYTNRKGRLQSLLRLDERCLFPAHGLTVEDRDTESPDMSCRQERRRQKKSRNDEDMRICSLFLKAASKS